MSNGFATTIDDIDEMGHLADMRTRRQIKREAQVSILTKDLSKRKRRHEDWMGDSD